MEEQQQEESNEQRASLSQQLTYGVGTFLAAGAIDMIAHFGMTGLVVGGIAAYVASQHGPGLLEQAHEVIPARPMRQARRVVLSSEGKSQRSVLDRALGRFPANDAEQDVEEVRDAPEPIPSARQLQRRRAGTARALLDLSPDATIDLDDLAGKAIFICGIRRHGKTTLGRRLAEQLGNYYLPLFIPDAEGDYLSLADTLSRAVIAGHPSVAGQYRGYRFEAAERAQDAHQLGYTLLERGYQVILDLSSYPSLDKGVEVQVNVIRGMFTWANTHPDERTTAHVYLDEAQRYLPQSLSDSVILNRTLLAELLRCYMDITAIGGKRGIAPVVLTQRFAQVNNKIMAQSEVFFLLRQTHDTDLDRCMEFADKQAVTKAQIAQFEPGQGVYIAATGTQFVLRFKESTASGKRGASPRPEVARRYAAMPMQREGTRNDFGTAFDTSRNRREISEMTKSARNTFDTPIEPFHGHSERTERRNFGANPEREMLEGVESENISDEGKTWQDVPEETRQSIIALYRQGKKRIAIRDALDLNGDEYWMVRAVCDEYERRLPPRPIRRV